MNFRPQSESTAQERANSTADTVASAAEAALRERTRLPLADRPILARNLGRLIEEAAGEGQAQALFVQLATSCKGRDSDALNSLLNKRRRYLRWRGEALDGPFATSRAEYLGFVEALAKVGTRLNETESLARRRYLLRLIEGSSFDSARLEQARTVDTAFADLLARVDLLGRRLGDHVNLHRYFERLSEHPVYVERAAPHMPGTFQWDPRADALSCTDTEARPQGEPPLMLGGELWRPGGLLFFPGKTNQTGDLFSVLPHVLLGHLSVVDDLKEYQPSVREAPDGTYVDELIPVRGEPHGIWRAPLYLVMAPDMLGNFRPGLLLDSCAAEEAAVEDVEARTEPPTYYDLRSAHNETYLVIDGSDECRLLLTSPHLEFEPSFVVPANTWTPLHYQSIGGMILANLRSAADEDRLDRMLADDARERTQAVEQLFGTELRRYEEEMAGR